MTTYREQIKHLHSELYPCEDLTERIIQAKQFIDRHYAESIDLDAVCEVAHVSKYHFIRLFKAHYGQTPYQYLRAVRVRKAKALIEGGMTVQAACFSVGYESVTSFSALFKKITGSAPSRLGEDRNFR